MDGHLKRYHFFRGDYLLFEINSNTISYLFGIFYSSRNGYCCPPSYNPADFLIGVLANTKVDKDNRSATGELCDAYEASNSKQSFGVFDHGDFIENNQGKVLKPYWIFTVFYLIHRNLLIIIRDPTIQKLRIIQKIVGRMNLIEYVIGAMLINFYLAFRRFPSWLGSVFLELLI